MSEQVEATKVQAHVYSKPATLLQDYLKKDAECQQQTAKVSSLRRLSGLRRRTELRLRRNSDEPETLVRSFDDNDRTSQIFQQGRHVSDVSIDRTLKDENDPGLLGTKKIIKKGLQFAELKTRPSLEKNRTPPNTYSRVSDREGAYGYFKDDVCQGDVNRKSELSDMFATIKENEKKEGQPYFYDEKMGTYHYPLGKKLDKSSLAQKGENSESIHKNGDEYYDESGEFMFRTPKERWWIQSVDFSGEHCSCTFVHRGFKPCTVWMQIFYGWIIGIELPSLG